MAAQPEEMNIEMPSPTNPWVILIVLGGIFAAWYFLWPKVKADQAKAEADKKTDTYPGMMADMFYPLLDHYTYSWPMFTDTDRQTLLDMAKDCKDNDTFHEICAQYQDKYQKNLGTLLSQALGPVKYKQFVKSF